MDHRRAVAAHYDGRAATYDQMAMHRELSTAVAEIVGDRGSTVLDVATGTGLMLRALDARRPGRRLIGIDLSLGMLGVARASTSAVLVQADATALPVSDDAVDLVTCITALHLFAEPAAVFSEWRRVLRPGGYAVTASFSGFKPGAIAPTGPDFVRRHADYRSAELVRAALAPFGFGLESTASWADDRDELLICVCRYDT